MYLLSIHNKRMFTTGFVLLVLFVISLAVGSIFLLSTREQKQFKKEVEKEIAYYIAESGYNLAVEMLLSKPWEDRWYCGPDPGVNKIIQPDGTEIVELKGDIIHSTFFEQNYGGGKFIVFIDEEPLLSSGTPEDTVLKCIHIYSKGIYKKSARLVYGRIVLCPSPSWWNPYWPR